MAGDGDDRLARTATAPGSQPTSSPGADDMPKLGDTLGRYKLQRELGAGAMGVVHAAFDPDLERRVALKVLRGTDSQEARQRLLREARAMARLAHPNVVTVHEVGSASARDYIAMELIDGTTLEDWLKAEPRSEHDIIAAFVAAGRGLAAAHAAGLVHRDFKPRNILRDKDGRIVVTDFGLVVGVEAGDISLETTLRPSQKQTSSPSSLSGLTATGSLLGTPAYMSPEQWTGKTIGPATDQFAFCVGLWEALAGERPFRGETLDDLKTAVMAGPAKLDDSKLPRRLRPILRRGLDPDPGKRWPSMDALLSAITRQRSRGLVLAIGGAAVAAGGVALALVMSGDDGPTCEPPAKQPQTVWSPTHAATLPAQPVAVGLLDDELRTWQQVRARACKASDQTRQARLACLDGVLARMDVVVRAMAQVGGTRRISVGNYLVDPAVCEAPRPPRLLTFASPELVDVVAATMRVSSTRARFEEQEAIKLIERTAKDPCAAPFARQLAASTRKTSATRNDDLDEAMRGAQRCGDDRLIADTAMLAVHFAMADVMVLDLQVSSKLKHAEAAVEAVPQLDLQGDLEMLRAMVAHRADNIDEAIKRSESAMRLYAQRGDPLSEITAGIAMLGYRESRGTAEDLAMVEPKLTEWRAAATKLLPADDDFVISIDKRLASQLWSSGDVAGAHARLAPLYRPFPLEKPQRILGRVVDETGAPVAGATVTAGTTMYGDGVSIAMPMDHLRSTTTGADGRFVLAEAAHEGVIMAQLADRRSKPLAIAGEVNLVVAPTSTIEGKVELRGEPATSVTIMVRDDGIPSELPYWGLRAPVRADGSFTVAGVPRGPVTVQTAVMRATATVVDGQQLIVDEPIEKVSLAINVSKRIVHVIVRSTIGVPVANGQAIVMKGVVPSSNLQALSSTLTSANVKMLRPLIGESAPPAVMAKAKPGDLYATIPEVPEGPVSACAVGLPASLTDESLDRDLKLAENRAKVEIPCVPLGPNDDVAIVQVPPWPRFD